MALAVALSSVLGCTCAKSDRSGKGSTGVAQEEEVAITPAEQPGARPVTLVLDPSGALCESALRAAAGARHVLCDRTSEDLSGAALRRGLGKLKAERGAAVVPEGAWLLVAPARVAVARAIVLRDPAFFSRVAAWVGTSPVTAGVFGPTFLNEVGGRGLRSLILVGSGAEAATTWIDLAARQGVRLGAWTEPESDDATWAALARAFDEGAPAVTDPPGGQPPEPPQKP